MRNERQSFLEYSQLLLRSTRNFGLPFCLNQDPCREQLAKDLVSTLSVRSLTSINLYIIYSYKTDRSKTKSCQYGETSYLVNARRLSENKSVSSVIFIMFFLMLLILTVTARKQFDAMPISNSVVSTNLLNRIQGKLQLIPFRYVSDDEGQNL